MERNKILAGKKIALCVTGSVAAIESPKIARELLRYGAEVHAYMTKGAMEIIHPSTMEFATGKEVVTKLTGKLEHLRSFDLILIAPATANTIGKIACGIGDSTVSALILGSKSKVLIAPAMHGSIYDNKLVKENIDRLKKHGFKFIEPRLEEGKAKLAGRDDIVAHVLRELKKKDFEGVKILVTSGPTLEYIDPVRVITNKSSGRMGIEVAKDAFFRGADVTLIYGTGSYPPPLYINVIRVETGAEMLEAVRKEISRSDIFVSAAAVADFMFKKAEKKISSRQKLTLEAISAPKILSEVKNSRARKVGFKALFNVSRKELIAASREMMEEHNLAFAVANDVSKDVFGSDENEVYLVEKNRVSHMARTTKAEIAGKILDLIGRKIK